MRLKVRELPPREESPAANRMERAWSRELETHLDASMIGFPILAYDSVTSTSDILKTMALGGAPEGLTVVARAQTNGRGQLGREWVSPPGQGAYLSIILKPDLPSTEVKWLGVLCALAAAQALQELGVESLSLKYPNDILARNRKLAGVLVEPRLGAGRVHFAIVGIGVNVLQQSHEWPETLKDKATSCRMEGVHVHCNQVITQVLIALDALYRRVRESGTAFLPEEWKRFNGSLPEF